jgi:cytochrome c553
MRGGRRYGVESRMIDKARRRIVSVPAAFAFLALAVAGCGGKAPENASAESTVPGTVHVCSSCHGPDGRSISPTFPRLAGQQKDYIIAQLQAFRDKTRADPHAQTYMWGMAARLSDPTIDAIAAYYSSQTPVAGSPGDSPQTVAGKNIFTEGIPSEGVPACMSCHGEKAEGNGPIPRLAGQHQAYLTRQLEAFASMARANEIMHENSKDLTAEQISEVTTYLATL